MSFSCFEFFIRLLAGYSHFTGHYGTVQFVDGRSVGKASRFEVETLVAAGFPCMALDDDGNDQFQVVVGQIPMNLDQLAALKLRTSPTQADQEQADAPTPTATSQAPSPSQPAAPEPVVSSHTRAELEAIADKSGLKGLRKVGDALEIKGKSIPELIERILKKQG